MAIVCAILSCTLLTGMTFPQNNTPSVDNYQNISNLLNYDNISLSKKQNFYHGNYSKNPQTSIAAYSKKGNWATSDTAYGSTQEQLLNSKINFIENIWNSNKEYFIIEDGINSDQINDMSDIQ